MNVFEPNWKKKLHYTLKCTWNNETKTQKLLHSDRLLVNYYFKISNYVSIFHFEKKKKEYFKLHIRYTHKKYKNLRFNAQKNA